MEYSSPDGSPLVCFCHLVSRKELLEAIQRGAATLYDLQLETRATTGCGGCESDVLDILEEAAKPDPAPLG